MNSGHNRQCFYVSSHFTDTFVLKKLLPIIVLLTACSTNHSKVDKTLSNFDTLPQKPFDGKDISDPTNTLNGKTETLELNYIVWGCACANWVTPADFKKYQNDKLAEHCIFIEPANKDLEHPLYFDPARHFIKVTGQFYVRPDYPKGTIQGEENLDKAKVFHYTKIDVFKNGKKVASIGALGMMDYPNFKKAEREGRVAAGTAERRRKAYKMRHRKDKDVYGTPGYYADKLLW